MKVKARAPRVTRISPAVQVLTFRCPTAMGATAFLAWHESFVKYRVCISNERELKPNVQFPPTVSPTIPNILFVTANIYGGGESEKDKFRLRLPFRRAVPPTSAVILDIAL